FDPLLGQFLLINVGAGANPGLDCALCIPLRYCLCQKPVKCSAGTVSHAVFHYMWPTHTDRGLPHFLCMSQVIRMYTLHPAITFDLFEGHRQIIAHGLIVVGDRPIGPCNPDKLRNRIHQGTEFLFLLLALGDISACTDEVLDLLILITMWA